MSRFLALLMGLTFIITGCQPASSDADPYRQLVQSQHTFAQAKPGYSFSFPADHGAHPHFRLEWWYLTANLQDQQGRQYGVQWTLFRQAFAPEQQSGWQDPQWFMAHVAISSTTQHAFAERYSRGGIGTAGVHAQPFIAWLDNWELKSIDPHHWLPLQVTSQFNQHGFSLRLTAHAPLVLQGDHGFSQKTAHQQQGSYYYSQPFLTAQGTLTLNGKQLKVSGPAWLDREWSSSFLQQRQTGWDWLALHLSSGRKLMTYRLRNNDGSSWLSGSLTSANGQQVTPLTQQDIELSVLTTRTIKGRRLPMRWQITLPGESLSLTTRPINEQQWMNTDFAYWEGAINVSGSESGVGYMELTGYPADQN